MRYPMLFVAAALLLAGCSEYGYRYPAHPQQALNPIFADYHVRASDVAVLIDTNGGRLESATILSHNSKQVSPRTVDYPKFEAELVRGTREEVYGPELATGPTTAHFELDAIGKPPWNVDIKVVGVPPVTVRLGN